MPGDTQSNTRVGSLILLAAAALTGLEGRVVKVNADGEAALPEAITDITPFVLTDGDEEGEEVTLEPLHAGGNFRLRANGVGSAGDVLVLCDPTAAAGVNAGKVQALPATEGAYFAVGIAEEDFVDEQLVKVRPVLRMVTVGAAFTGATPVATAATNAGTPYGFATQAQADALVASVREIRAFLAASGLKPANA